MGTCFACRLHRDIELRNGHLVVVAKGVVRSIEQLGNASKAFANRARLKNLGELAHALDLIDDVPAAPLDHGIGDATANVGSPLERDIPQAFHAQRTRPRFGLRPALRILAAHEAVRGTRVNDEQRETLTGEVPRNGRRRKIPAVEKNCVALLAED